MELKLSGGNHTAIINIWGQLNCSTDIHIFKMYTKVSNEFWD